MTSFAKAKVLLRVSKAPKALVDNWREARHLESESGKELGELIDRATVDRLGLAEALLRDARKLLKPGSRMLRASVSRSYYSMYHAMRAASFYAHGGDDHQEHRVLPTKAPEDMADRDVWSNKLKDARERRNAADYDPYPKSDKAYLAVAEALLVDANGLVSHVRVYLRSKQCRFL